MMISFVIAFSSSQKMKKKTEREWNLHFEGSESAFEMLIEFYVIAGWGTEVHHDVVIDLDG